MRRNEGRTVGLFTKVSPEEKAVIDRKMAEMGTNQSAGISAKNGGGRLCDKTGHDQCSGAAEAAALHLQQRQSDRPSL